MFLSKWLINRFHVILPGCKCSYILLQLKKKQCHAEGRDTHATRDLFSNLPMDTPCFKVSIATIETAAAGTCHEVNISRNPQKFMIDTQVILLMVQNSCVHQLRLVVHPIICRVLYIPGGAGFLPSTVAILKGDTCC